MESFKTISVRSTGTALIIYLMGWTAKNHFFGMIFIKCVIGLRMLFVRRLPWNLSSFVRSFLADLYFIFIQNQIVIKFRYNCSNERELFKFLRKLELALYEIQNKYFLNNSFFIPKNCAKVNYYVIKLIKYNSIKKKLFSWNWWENMIKEKLKFYYVLQYVINFYRSHELNFFLKNNLSTKNTKKK